MITFKKNLEEKFFPRLHGNGRRRSSTMWKWYPEAVTYRQGRQLRPRLTSHEPRRTSLPRSNPDPVPLGILSGLWCANNMIFFSSEQRHWNAGTTETQVSSLYGPFGRAAGVLLAPNTATCDGKIHYGRKSNRSRAHLRHCS